MATFVLIHGGGSTAWDWHLVTPLLEENGHRASAVDLPTENDDAGLTDYVDTVAAAAGGAADVVVVGHSLGGFTAPLAAERSNAKGLVYLAGMIPLPGENFGDWWANTGHSNETISEDEEVAFYNLVPEPLKHQARERSRDQQGAWLSLPWPGERHPDVPTLGIVCMQDQFFPPEFMRRQIRDRLGIEPVEIPGGHYAPISHPKAVAAALDAFAQKISSDW